MKGGPTRWGMASRAFGYGKGNVLVCEGAYVIAVDEARLLLLCVLWEGYGVFFEDVDEDVVKELLHNRVGVAESRAGIGRWREVFCELLDFLDDVARARVFRFEFLDKGECFPVGMRMLAHQREDELFFLGKVFFELCLESSIEMVEAREHLTVMRVVDDENLIEEFLCFRHETTIRDMMCRFEVIEHFRDSQLLERLDVSVDISLRRFARGDFVQICEELFHLHSLFAYCQ